MNDLDKLINELEKIINDEASTPLDVRGSYVIGAILRKEWDLYDTNTIVQTIESDASNLETRNGTDEELEHAWQEIKRLTQVLKDQQKNNS